MADSWIDDFETVSANALTYEWFASPLEYHWPDARTLLNRLFGAPGASSAGFDQMVAPALYKMSMQVDFRAKMTVYAFMRQSISQSFGLEIESGLLSFYQLDFLGCLSQWIFVIEGYCRKLFQVTSQSNVKSAGWTIPHTGNLDRDRLITALSGALATYLDSILYLSASNPHVERLSRHLLLHGNAENNKFFSQKNCLILMFLLDALVTIEMVTTGDFPAVFNDRPGEAERIERRKTLYMLQLQHAFDDTNLLRINVLEEHV